MRKSKPWADMEEDPENVVIKIPRGTTVFSNPSELQFASKRAAAFSYQAFECSMFFNKAVESAQKRNKEKSNTSLRKSTAKAVAAAQMAEGRARELEQMVKQLEASLKFEKETSGAEIEAFKEAVGSLEKQKIEWAEEKEVLTEQLLDMAYEAQMKLRHDMMKEYLAGEHDKWTLEKWIRSYERFVAGEIGSSDEEEAAAPAPAPAAGCSMEVEPTHSPPAQD